MEKRYLLIIFVGIVSLVIVSALVWNPKPVSGKFYTYEIINDEKIIFLKKFTGIEKYLIDEKDVRIIEDNVVINLKINTNAYNWLMETYDNWASYTNQQKLDRCNIIKSKIIKDYPNFDCLNSAHQQILKDKINTFMELGLKIRNDGVDRGYVELSPGNVKITIPKDILIDRGIIKIGEDSLHYESQNQTSIFYKSNHTNITISLYDNDMPMSVNDIFINEINHGDNLKFGATHNNMTDLEFRNFTYLLKSTSKIFKDGLILYVKEPIPINDKEFEIHKFNFSDICNREFETNCEFKLYQQWNNNKTRQEYDFEIPIYDYFAEINFISDKNIDPTIGLDNKSEFPEYMECLFKTFNNTGASSAAEAESGSYKRGDLVYCKPLQTEIIHNESTGENKSVRKEIWGKKERDNTKFGVVILEYNVYNASWLNPERSGENLTKRRAFSLPVDSFLTTEEINKLNSGIAIEVESLDLDNYVYDFENKMELKQ